MSESAQPKISKKINLRIGGLPWAIDESCDNFPIFIIRNVNVGHVIRVFVFTCMAIDDACMEADYNCVLVLTQEEWRNHQLNCEAGVDRNIHENNIGIT